MDCWIVYILWERGINMEQINMMSQWQKCRNDAAYPVEHPDGTIKNYVNTRKATEILRNAFLMKKSH